MGYRGIETTELILDDHQVSADQILGGEPGKGFFRTMDGVEVGRVNVAARACGIDLRAFELGITYAQQRQTFGEPIAQHQAILFRIAEMASNAETAQRHGPRGTAERHRPQDGRRIGMAKMIAAEHCNEVVEASFRIHGGYG